MVITKSAMIPIFLPVENSTRPVYGYRLRHNMAGGHDKEKTPALRRGLSMSES
jgi:hypothetical protein